MQIRAEPRALETCEIGRLDPVNSSQFAHLVAVQALILPGAYFVWVVELAIQRAHEPTAPSWRKFKEEIRELHNPFLIPGFWFLATWVLLDIPFFAIVG